MLRRELSSAHSTERYCSWFFSSRVDRDDYAKESEFVGWKASWDTPAGNFIKSLPASNEVLVNAFGLRERYSLPDISFSFSGPVTKVKRLRCIEYTDSSRSTERNNTGWQTMDTDKATYKNLKDMNDPPTTAGNIFRFILSGKTGSTVHMLLEVVFE